MQPHSEVCRETTVQGYGRKLHTIPQQKVLGPGGIHYTYQCTENLFCLEPLVCYTCNYVNIGNALSFKLRLIALLMW